MFTKKDRIRLFNALERLEDTTINLLEILSEAQVETPSVSDNEKSKEIGCLNCIYNSNGYLCALCDDKYSRFEPIG